MTEEYEANPDMSSLVSGQGYLQRDKISLQGQITAVYVTEEGEIVFGENFDLRVKAIFEISVISENGPQQVFVGFTGDTSILTVGADVTIFGTYAGTNCGLTFFDTSGCTPLVHADQIELGMA